MIRESLTDEWLRQILKVQVDREEHMAYAGKQQDSPRKSQEEGRVFGELAVWVGWNAVVKRVKVG